MTRDYSAAIDAVFGPVKEAAPAPSSTLPADAADTSGGINAALDATPGMMEREARERLTPAPAPVAPGFPWSNPTAAWYTPPEEKPAEGISTQMLRGQMAEREITRHALFPEGENDDGAGGLLRASFMLNNASRYSQDDIFTAATISAANGMPFDLTLDSLDKARDMLTEFTPARVKDFAQGFLRLVQYDYDSAMLWRHDIPTANAIAASFEVSPDVDSRAAALGRGLSGAGTMLLQVGINLGRMGLEGLAALARGVDENYQLADTSDRPIAAALLETSDTMLDWVRQLSERQKEISAESPLAGMKVWDNPEVLLDSRWWLENSPQVAASLLPMLGAYAWGGKLAAGLMGLAMNDNEIYVDLLDAGMEDNAETRLWSLLGGVAMSALDVVGLTGILGDKEAIKAAVKTAIATAAREGLKGAAAYAGKGAATGYLFEGSTEYAQNLVKAGIEAIAKDKDFGGVVAEIGEAATQLEDFILGGLMGGVIRGGHDVTRVRGERKRQVLQASIEAAAKSEEVAEARAEVEAVVEDNAEAQRRMAFAQSLLQTAEAADSSALHQADPAIFEREAEKLMPEDARSVWLDVDTVREFAGEDNARLEALGLSPRDMADAVQIQAGSVRVPTVRLVSRFQGEDRILLLQSARMTPDGMTLTEAQAFDPRKRSEAAAERIRARNRVNAEIGKERTRLKNEFVQAGYAAHVAEYYATMHAEQAKAFADRYGSDAAQLLRERSIVRGNAEAAGQARPWQTAFDKSPDSFFSQGAMAADSSLPQRFAEMPGVEADSSHWFGEGKAIAADGQNARKAVVDWARTAFPQGTTIKNADQGWAVQVTPNGIKASLHHGYNDLLARSVPFIPQIVESGIHVDSIRKTPQLMSHIFANKIRLDGKDYVVGFVLREDINGNRFYDHELTEIIDPDWLKPGHPSKEGPSGEGSSGHRTNRGDVMNILRDKLGVNDGSGQVLFQTAYHGTPYRFDKFSLDNIDTGEGAQAHGWGLYFAKDKASSERYRNSIDIDIPVDITLDGKPFYDGVRGRLEFSTGNWIADGALLGYNGNIDEAIERLQGDVDYGMPEARDAIAVLQAIKADNRLNVEEIGQIFKVDIPENDVLLDEQKTLEEQPEIVRRAVEEFLETVPGGWEDQNATGKELYELISDHFGSDEKASLWLNEHGVKGITYYGKYDGRCFVIFDDKAIDILNKFFQTDSGPASARGMVQFRADGSSVTSIFAGASDLSTPIHEGAHIFINDLIRVVAGGWRMAEQLWARESSAVYNDASIDDSLRKRRLRALTQRWNKHKMGLWQAREDLAALVENANAQREAHGKAIGAHLPPVTLEEVVQGTATPEQIRTLQEVNAVSFEGYVREGRAPSSKLAAVFHKMRQWLAAIYRLAGIHGVKVTPDVRRVFDRMLANDEAIRKSAAGKALAGEGEFLSIVQDEEAELVIDESGQWKRKDRINYKAALNRQSEHERLQELYERAEAHVTARMDKATLRDRNKRWKAYYDEGKEMARGDVYYEIVAALTVKEGNPYSGINRAWLEHQYGKAAVADFMKTAQGRRLLNKNGGQTLDAVGVGDIVGNMDRAVAMGIADADGLYNYLYDNVVTRRRSLADDARAWADQRMADDDARAEEAGNDPGEAYRAYLEEVEVTVLRLAARQDAGWRTPEQQARWVEEQRTPLTQVRRQVKSILRGRPLKEILPNQFVGEVRKALQERNAALAAGNALDALAAVDRARTALESWIEANRIRKEQEDFERLAKRLSALKRDVVVPEAWTAIQDMLERFELTARRRAGDSPVTLSEAVASLCADSAEINGLPAIAEWLLNEKESGSYRNLTAEQLLDVSDVLKMLEHMGREALASNKASEAARVREMADAGNDNMSGLAPMSVAREGTLRRKWQDWMRSYFGGMLSSIQWQMRQADGFSNLGPEGRRGIGEERMYGAIADGESRREVRMRRLVERMEPVFRRLAESAKKWEAERGKALTGADGKPLPVPEIMRRGGKLNWTADRVIALAMNLGNEGNALRLREGYPDLTADTLAQLVGDDATRLVFPEWRSAGNEGLLSAQDWRDVQEVGNILQSQWKDIQATHERMFGFKPRGVEARPMTIRVKGESVSLNGWYYPAVYDPSLSPEVQKRQEQQDAIVRTEAVCAAPAAKRGFTRARANGGGGAPLLLETGVIMAHLNDVTRFIELAETVRFADRVTRSAQWRDAYIRAFGRQDYDAIRPNLKGIVLEERPATDAISKSADWLRERLVPWGLAFNFKTALLQSTAIFPAMNDLGAANVLRGVAAVAKGRYALVRQIWEQSPYMKSRARNIDQDLRKTLQGVDARTRQKTLKLLGKEISWQDVVDAGMLPLVSVDMAASSAIWMAAYNREMTILANSRNVLPGIDPASEHHAAAVRAADMAVKAVNPDFNPSSRSQFLRSRGAVRLLNIFSSAVVLFAQRRAYNAAARRQAIHAGGGGYRARLAAWRTYARYEAYDFALQGISMGLILSLAYGEDEPDKWAKNMGGAWLDAASMRVPVFNSMITGLITGDTWRGMSTVYQQPWDMAKRLRGAAKTGEADKLTASMADVLSFLVKVPASRVWRNAERGYEQWEKGEGTPASVLMPRPNSY